MLGGQDPLSLGSKLAAATQRDFRQVLGGVRRSFIFAIEGRFFHV